MFCFFCNHFLVLPLSFCLSFYLSSSLSLSLFLCLCPPPHTLSFSLSVSFSVSLFFASLKSFLNRFYSYFKRCVHVSLLLLRSLVTVCRYFFLVFLILPVPHYLSFCFHLFLSHSLNPLSNSLSISLSLSLSLSFSLYLCLSLVRSIWKLVFLITPYMLRISYIITNYTVLYVFRSSALDLYYHRLFFIF